MLHCRDWSGVLPPRCSVTATEVRFDLTLYHLQDRGQDQVPDACNDQQRHSLEIAAVDRFDRVEQIRHRDDADQRSQLQRRDDFTAGRRHDDPHRLRQDHPPQAMRVIVTTIIVVPACATDFIT